MVERHKSIIYNTSLLFWITKFKREVFIIPKYYARFKEAKEEIIAFPTQEQRDNWINFKDEFSLATKNNSEITTFQRIPLTKRQAEYIIKALCLTETEPEHPTEEKITIFRNVTGEGKVMKKNNKISLEPTMGLTERKMIASATEKNAIKIGTKKLAWIPVDLLNVKPYQRDRQRHINSIAENWDDNKCNVLIVSYEEENGCFNVVDGQHRAVAARMRGIEYLVCEILNDLNVSSEAKLFVDANINSKKLNPFDTFKANMFISDEDDNELSRIDKCIAKICKEYGVEVKKSEACGVLKSVPQARKIIKSEGEGCLRFIFDIIQESHWDNYKNGYCYIVVETLRKIWKYNQNNLDDIKKKLCGYLIKVSPTEVDSLGNKEYANLCRPARWDAVMSQIIA